MAEPDRTGPRGRASHLNPPNRFTRLHVELDPEALDEDERPSARTEFLRDDARSVVTENDSPDIPFRYSVNPYRGCEHGCTYCVSGDTLILMADGSTRPLEQVRAGDMIYGTVRKGWYRHYAKTRVLAHWRVNKPAYRVRLRDGTCLIAGADHRFWTERGWKFVAGHVQGKAQRPHLTTNDRLLGTGAFSPEPRFHIEGQ